MPLYYFHIRKGEELIRDLEGTELGSTTAALEEAKAAAQEILANKVRRGEVIDGNAFEIEDETGTRLFHLPFKSVLRLE
jgi:hypothetical protein